MTMVSSGSSDVGASKITQELLDIVIKMPQAMEQLTGVDITKVCVFIITLHSTILDRIYRTNFIEKKYTFFISELIITHSK